MRVGEKGLITVRLSPAGLHTQIIGMTPGGKGEWGNCRFVVEAEECDWWVVDEKLRERERARVPRGHTILITAEPPSIKSYQPGYIRQFSTVVTCHKGLNHPHVLNQQQALPWMVGRDFAKMARPGYSISYDDLKAMGKGSFLKEKELSVISSNKNFIEGHRQRTAFAKALESHFQERIEVFGRGFRDVGDKWEAIAPYKYHVSLENSSHQDYWTEKLSDAYLGAALPLYYGCPNLEDYFSRGSFIPIDIRDIEGSINTIEHAIETNAYERSLEDIMVARELVLDKYNLFAMLAEICGGQDDGSNKRTISLRPEATFGRTRAWLGRRLGRG